MDQIKPKRSISVDAFLNHVYRLVDDQTNKALQHFVATDRVRHEFRPCSKPFEVRSETNQRKMTKMDQANQDHENAKRLVDEKQKGLEELNRKMAKLKAMIAKNSQIIVKAET